MVPGVKARGRDVMRLSNSLLVLLFHVSQFRSSALTCSSSEFVPKVPVFTVCATSNQTKPLNKTKCKYPYSPPFERCHDDTSPSALCWTAGDNGTVEVEFPLLPQACEYTSYEASLKVNETVHHNCSSPYLEFSLHSTKTANVNYTEPLRLNHCTKRGKLTFRHVFSGCYQLIVTPSSSLQPCEDCKLKSRPSYLSTGHEKTPIPDRIPLHPERKNDRSLDLDVKFNYPPLVSQLELKLLNLEPVNGPGLRTTSVFLETTSPTGSRQIECKSNNGKSNVTCHNQGENVVSCEFSHLNPGNYCAHLIFFDDRCERNSMWDNKDYKHDMCNWKSEDVEISPVILLKPESLQSRSNGSILLLTLLFVSFILGCVGLAFWKLRHPRLPAVRTGGEEYSQVPAHPRVLLLYARDCPAFLEAIAQLKSELRIACRSEVIDCWEADQFQDVAENSFNWLIKRFFDDTVCTVLVTSPASIRLQYYMVRNIAVHYREPQAFDSVFMQALNFLHQHYTSGDYTNLFVVRLDSRREFREELNEAEIYLSNPCTYELPVHRNALLRNLQNINRNEWGVLENMELDVDRLDNAISEYRKYLRENPNYLNSLLS